uniref:Uncharacterized protein n=1 Tax=Oryza punctata TaxID=4537 RepID=A0A0E0LJ53_ORYPU
MASVHRSAKMERGGSRIASGIVNGPIREKSGSFFFLILSLCISKLGWESEAHCRKEPHALIHSQPSIHHPTPLIASLTSSRPPPTSPLHSSRLHKQNPPKP